MGKGEEDRLGGPREGTLPLPRSTEKEEEGVPPPDAESPPPTPPTPPLPRPPRYARSGARREL